MNSIEFNMDDIYNEGRTQLREKGKVLGTIGLKKKVKER